MYCVKQKQGNPKQLDEDLQKKVFHTCMVGVVQTEKVKYKDLFSLSYNLFNLAMGPMMLIALH